jgi:D-alanyl-D-alanine carboxypeptidase/D-alanyl-D-alanine-endopeptidase (penicillin-binding protein 4)
VTAGRGDPSWGARETKPDFEQVFAPFVAAVEHAGIHLITGDIVADATYLRVGPQGEGWAANDLAEDFGAEVSAITLEDNFADIRVKPGAAIGDACSAEILQPFTGLQLDNRTKTVAADGPRRLQLVRVAGESTVQLFGTMPLGGKEELTNVSVPRPAAWFARGLKAALERKGIPVRGGVHAWRWPEVAPDWSKAFAVGAVSSPPLRELVKGFMKPSQNLETDLVFLHLGETRRTAKTPASTDSNDLALAELHAFLCENALHADDVIFDEGSGLSRNNLASSAAIVSLLRYMHTHRESAAFEAALPIAGVDGTLRRRFKGTPAENNLRAKTGSLRWAASLAGLVTTSTGEHVVFSFMLNRYAAPLHRSAREELDELAAIMIGYDAKK